MLNHDNAEFARDASDLQDRSLAIKQARCPHCRRGGTLNAHGFLRGYAESGSARVVRGRRFFCSSRRAGHRGCGRTFSVLLQRHVAGFTVSTLTLLVFVLAVLGGASRKVAWEAVAPPGFHLRSAYRLWQRLTLVQTHWRTQLLRLAPPPPCLSSLPLAGGVAHLRVVFADDDAFGTFQRSLGVSLLPRQSFR